MGKEYIFFPISKKGYWHNGIHRYKKDSENTIFSLFFGMVLIKSQNVLPKVFPEKIPKYINKRDIEIRNPDFIEKKGYEEQLSIELSKLSKKEQEEVLAAIGLSSIPTYILQRHTISFGGDNFVYYSFARHLSKLYELKKILNKEYVFPHDRLGAYGESECEKDMFQQEYFITAKSNFFKIENPEIYDYCFISDSLQLYQIEEQNHELLHFEKETKFSALNTETDYRENLHSLHLQIKEIPVRLSADYYNENSFKISISNSRIEIYDNHGNHVNPLTAEIMNPFTGAVETITISSEHLKALARRQIFCIENRFDLPDFWTDADNAILKQWDKNVIVKTDAALKAFTLPPDRKKFSKLNSDHGNFDFQFFKVQEADCITIFKSLDCKKFVRILDGGKNYYFSYDDIKYTLNYWKDFKNSTIIFFKEDLKSYNINDDDDKNSIDFQNILKSKNIIDDIRPMPIEDFLKENRVKILKCAFQHISEWSQIKLNPLKNNDLVETAELWKNLHIWGADGKSSRLPKEIADSGEFIYLHPDYFENWLFNLHRCFAEKLKTVQDIVMEDWRLKQGNCGMYYNSHSDIQTFCNHAVYETIKKVDGNYLSFLMGIDEPPWDTRKYKCIHTKENKHDNECENKKQFFSFLTNHNNLEKNNYKYKPSNLWCDVLEYQAERSGKTGIYKITAEQAFYMAQLGYVVIAAWKNLTPKGNDPNINYSPHFVTVSPVGFMERFNKYDCPEVAHVGGGENRRLPVFDAFSTEYGEEKANEIYFYCNLKQKFI